MKETLTRKEVFIGTKKDQFIIASDKNELITSVNELKVPKKLGERATNISLLTNRLLCSMMPQEIRLSTPEIGEDEILVNKKVYKKASSEPIDLDVYIKPKFNLNKNLMKAFYLTSKTGFILTIIKHNNFKYIYFTYNNIDTQDGSIGGEINLNRDTELSKHFPPQQEIWPELKLEAKIVSPILMIQSKIIKTQIDQFFKIDGIFKISTFKKNDNKLSLRLEAIGSFYDTDGNQIGRYLK